MMIKGKSIPLLYTSILYICGLLLFLEWLYPVKELIDIANMQIFIVYTVVCFFISMLNMKWPLTFIGKGIGLLVVVYYLMTNDPLISQPFFQSLFTELTVNIKLLLSQNWGALTDVFRSILFLLLIWLVSYLIHYWFLVMKRIFLFVLLTFVYIGLLDTFTAYNAHLPIVRVFIISMIALALANVFKHIYHEQTEFPWTKKAYVWLLPMVGIVLLTSMIGYTAPKYEPQWPDPVPFLQGVTDFSSQKGTGSHTGKAGFGENDEQLGGSFQQDDTLVFRAMIESEQQKHYWRILTKDTYTGKGWETSATSDYTLQQPDWIALETFYHESVDTDERTANLEFPEKMALDKITYPYGIREIDASEKPQYFLDETTEAIQTKLDNKNVNMMAYTVTYDYPLFDISSLQQSTSGDSNEEISQYTQLPESLPNRVADLAEDITGEYTNRYDQVRAIEQYFGYNGFTYEIQDVPVPTEDEDYVDQFLFETKHGYCDNYSTAMTVMLRTLDIPARWVKGFTAGESTGQTISKPDGDYDMYEVTNMNAHSWVEVYFPEAGWVPFEPTQGFDNLAEFVDSDSDVHEDDNVDTDLENPEDPEELPELDKSEEELTTPETDQVIDNKGIKKPLYMNGWYVGIGLFLLLLLLFILYHKRFHVKTIILSKKLQRNFNDKNFEEAYHHLLEALKHYCEAKEPQQTLREYAKQIDHQFRSTEMGLLTNYYEQMLYNREIREVQEDEQIKLWNQLMKRVLAK